MFRFIYTNPHAPEYKLTYLLEELPGGIVKMCPQEGWFHELVDDGYLHLPDEIEVSKLMGYEVKEIGREEYPDYPEECVFFKRV